ncbi:MAG: glycosyltransferase family 2 protein [Acidobacteriota bacterium]|nr:glycosyltransferase family 2 protein [Acidobacteriota bacterium]
MEGPSVYIIVLTYNMRQVARRCLHSLRALNYSNHRIVVVDNASSDGTEAMMRDEFSGLPFIQTGSNCGYTGGNNRGIEYALTQGADYVLLLNPDTVLVNPDFIDEMVAYLEAHPQVGIAGPRVFFREAGIVQNTVLFPPGLWRSIVHWGRYRINPRFAESSGEEVVDASVLNGVSVMLRAECLRQTGLLDENIFMYIEDADLDYRAHAHGWRVQYLPIDSVIHQQKAEGYHMTSLVSFLLKRNSVYYLCKIGKRLDAWGYAILSLLLLVTRGLFTFSAAGIREHAGFCRKLASAYQQILLGRKLDAGFGPPFE